MVAPRLEQRALSLRQRERVRALLRDPRTPPGQRAAVRAIAAHHIAWQFAFEAALNAHVAGARLAFRADRMRPNRRWRLPPALGLQRRWAPFSFCLLQARKDVQLPTQTRV